MNTADIVEEEEPEETTGCFSCLRIRRRQPRIVREGYHLRPIYTENRGTYDIIVMLKILLLMLRIHVLCTLQLLHSP